jgi:glycosyltransferase involved in cell wall biosynthesis
MDYSVLIRTFNSAKTLPDVLRWLSRQTVLPKEYIFVDSGSTDGTRLLIPKGARIVEYAEAEFNYSHALNQGLKFVSTEIVLIVSSHTLLSNDRAIGFGIDVLQSDERIGAAYFDQSKPSSFSSSHAEKSDALKCTFIDKHNFDGFNGLWNTCSLVKMALLKRRGFRPEVFTAEDQEWASWLFHFENKIVARISGAGMENSANPNSKYGPWKTVNEYIAIAYFSNRALLGWFNIARVASRVVKPRPLLPMICVRRSRFFYGLLFLRLVACHFVKPKSKSKYF